MARGIYRRPPYRCPLRPEEFACPTFQNQAHLAAHLGDAHVVLGEGNRAPFLLAAARDLMARMEAGEKA